MKIKNTEIEIIKGDITELNVDAIVNPANAELIMGQGLAHIIKEKGGKIIEDEYVEKDPVNTGEAVITNAGQLKANYIIHAVINNRDSTTDQHTLRSAVCNVFNIANELNLYSIAIPAIGCGVSGFPEIASAKIIAQEILKAVKQKEPAVGKIIICLNDDETFQIFNNTIKGYITHIQDTLCDGPYVTVDIIIELKEGIIVIERSNPPFGYALPGGFVDYGESIETAARREAKEETDLDLEKLRQFHTYSDPNRDPRFHTVSTVFIAKGTGAPKAGDDAKGLKIVKYEDLLSLEYAFDHKGIIKDYLRRGAKGNINNSGQRTKL